MYGLEKYGLIQYGLSINNKDPINYIGPDLMCYVPHYYKYSNVFISIFNSASNQIGKLNYNIEDIKKQIYIDTSTWGLEFWEKDLGITTDISKSYETRRENIKARIRGVGTSTLKMIKDTALTYTNAEIDIIENPSDYSFIIKFIGIKGIPINMGGFLDTIETIKPAHLAYTIQYTYTVWQFLLSKSLNWSKAISKTWDDLKIYE